MKRRTLLKILSASGAVAILPGMVFGQIGTIAEDISWAPDIAMYLVRYEAEGFYWHAYVDADKDKNIYQKGLDDVRHEAQIRLSNSLKREVKLQS